MKPAIINNTWETWNVSFEPKGYRDVVWCPYGNEPAIIGSYGESEKSINCPECNGNFEYSTHPFICHLGKPDFSRADD